MHKVCNDSYSAEQPLFFIRWSQKRSRDWRWNDHWDN